jgi:histidine triad (HIT) family protein
MQAYDSTNIFARILRGEIPNQTVLDTAHSLAFADIRPLAPVHVLVIPKGAYVDHVDFASRASDAEIADFARAVAIVAEKSGVTAQGYRLIANSGGYGGQEVPHYHVHVLGGRALGRMLAQ